MNKFLAKNKVNLEKMFLVIFLYIYMITFLAYILTDHFYSYGFNIGVLYSALLFAFAWWICGFRRNFLIAYLGMMFFLCSGILIKLFDHIIVMALDIFVNISLASIIWISILLIGFCINNAEGIDIAKNLEKKLGFYYKDLKAVDGKNLTAEDSETLYNILDYTFKALRKAGLKF